MKKILIISVLISAPWLLSGQDLHYEIIRNGKPIGTLDVGHTKNETEESFHIRNLVNFKMVFTFHVEYELKEHFKGGMLISGSGFNTLNGISQKETAISYDGSGYHLIIDGVEAHNEETPIRQSMAAIYHQEPYDGKQLYSQYFGRYLTINQTEEHTYLLKSPDGENIYKYTNGYCAEVKVIRDFATFSIKMSPETLASVQNK